MKNEIKVGIFVSLALIAILYLTFQVKSLQDLIGRKGYVLYAVVGDASGLAKKSRVKMRGVKIGVIDNLKLTQNGVKLTLLIDKGVKIPVGSVVTLAQDNVLGGRFLEIIPSNSHKYYKPGEMITKYMSSASITTVMDNINSAVSDIKVLINKLNKTLNEKTINNIHTTVANIKESSFYLKNVLKDVNNKLPALLNNANSLVVTYKQTGEIIKRKLPPILNKANILMTKLNSLADTLHVKVNKLANTYIKLGENANNLLAENKNSIKATIVSAKKFFTSGTKGFKKIDNFLSAFNKSQIDVNVYSNYLTKDDYFRTTANVYYIPNPTRYYIVGVTAGEDYSSPQAARNKTSKVYLNAEIGRRFQNLLLRGGIIESTGGFGVDYFTDKNRLKYTVNVYDFNGQNDYRGSNPHIDIKARYLYLKHLEFIAGVYNLINVNARQFFLGVGIKFEDNDLKALMSGGAASLLK